MRLKLAITVPAVILGAGAYYGAIARPLWQAQEDKLTRQFTQSLPASSGPQGIHTNRAKILVGAFQVIGSVNERVTNLKQKLEKEMELFSNMMKVSSSLISCWRCVYVKLLSDRHWLRSSCAQLTSIRHCLARQFRKGHELVSGIYL